MSFRIGFLKICRNLINLLAYDYAYFSALCPASAIQSRIGRFMEPRVKTYGGCLQVRSVPPWRGKQEMFPRDMATRKLRNLERPWPVLDETGKLCYRCNFLSRRILNTDFATCDCSCSVACQALADKCIQTRHKRYTWCGLQCNIAVSYTHLTLPTICSV